MIYQELPLNRPTNPFRNQGYLLRLAGGCGQKGGSIGGIITRRSQPIKTYRSKNRQLGCGLQNF